MNRSSHVVQEPEGVVPAATLVEGRIDEQPGLRVERVAPPAGERVELIGEGVVVDMAGDLRGAVMSDGEVEGVRDRVGDAVLEVLLAVEPAQVGVHVQQCPLPVDAR